jgi:hypothetical protein
VRWRACSDDRGVRREDRPPFVLLRGAWLGGWAWRDVARRPEPELGFRCHEAIEVVQGTILDEVTSPRMRRAIGVVWVDDQQADPRVGGHFASLLTLPRSVTHAHSPS